MKINLILNSDRQFIACDEESQAKMNKFKIGAIHSHDVKLNNNYKLHKKIFGFFAFCTRYYYGDMDAAKNKYNVDYVRGEITKGAGYYEQVFNRTGGFKIVPRSLAYESMCDEERQEFYKAITDAALRMVFDQTTDENVINQLLSWF